MSEINKKLEALEEKFANDNDETAFVEGMLDIIYDSNFASEVAEDKVGSDSLVFSWVTDYNPIKDEYEGDRLDLDNDPFDYGDVSDANKKRINDAIREVMKDYYEEMAEYDYMMRHPFLYGVR